MPRSAKRDRFQLIDAMGSCGPYPGLNGWRATRGWPREFVAPAGFRGMSDYNGDCIAGIPFHPFPRPGCRPASPRHRRTAWTKRSSRALEGLVTRAGDGPRDASTSSTRTSEPSSRSTSGHARASSSTLGDASATSPGTAGGSSPARRSSWTRSTSFRRKRESERRFAERIGLKSNVSIPLSVGGRLVSVIATGTFAPRRRWSPEVVERVRIVGRDPRERRRPEAPRPRAREEPRGGPAPAGPARWPRTTSSARSSAPRTTSRRSSARARR